MDFTEFKLSTAQAQGNNRGAYRTRIPGLKIVVAGYGIHDVKDLSATGVAFNSSESGFAIGDQVEVALVYSEHTLVENLQAQIVRAGMDGSTACLFMKPSLRQEAKLDKLVLEVQKRLISLRKAKEDKLPG